MGNILPTLLVLFNQRARAIGVHVACTSVFILRGREHAGHGSLHVTVPFPLFRSGGSSECGCGVPVRHFPI